MYMSTNNCIIKTINLKDGNIKFDEKFCDYELIKGVKSLVYYASLDYKPDFCLKCGCVFDNNIHRHGEVVQLIYINKISKQSAYLKLRKQRYKCNHCVNTFILHSSDILLHCNISNQVKYSIALDAVKFKSIKDIANDHNVSHNTVSRVLDNAYETFKPNYNYLPEAIQFDEFKSTKSDDGAMSFVFKNASSDRIIDIYESRKQNFLLRMLSRYTKQARNKVKFIVIDMYAPYIYLIKKIFPHAAIVFDKFHIVNHISRALNKTRINTMNSNKIYYNKFKRYWRLLLKSYHSLNNTYYRNYTCFNKPMTELMVVQFLVNVDPTLKATYNYYQDFLFYINNGKFDSLSSLIFSPPDDIFTNMKIANKTFTKYEEYVINAYKYPYSNGSLEWFNKKIKVIKRIAF